MRTSWIARLIVVASGSMLLAAHAFAQVQTMPVAVCKEPLRVTGDAMLLDDLTTLNNSGQREELRTRAMTFVGTLLTAVKKECPKDPAGTDDPKALLNTETHYVALNWVGADPRSGKAAYVRIVLHGKATSARESGGDANLPGIGTAPIGARLVEVFVGRSPGASVRTVFTSTREENPAVAQLPAFVQLVAGPMFAIIGAIAGSLQQSDDERAIANQRLAAAKVQDVWVRLAVATLPHARASIRMQATARDAVDPGVFVASARTLVKAVSYKEAAHSPVARRYAVTLADTLAAAIDGEACSAAAGRDRCAAEIDRLMVLAWNSARPPNASDAELAALEAVDSRFRTLVANDSSTVADADITFHNRPLTRWSFGAGAAVVTSASSPTPRVRLDNSGHVVADPLPRALTMAHVNWSPRGFDDHAPGISPDERCRPFFGAALTPDFGIVSGLNVLIVRGIGVSAGVAFLFAKGADAEDIGKPPADSRKPLSLTVPMAFFIGITYNFK